MGNQNNLISWLAIIVIVIGIASIVAMTVQSDPEPIVLPTKPASTATSTEILPTQTPTPKPTIALPTVTFTPLPLNLPQINIPAGGKEYRILPISANDVGWLRSGDMEANHFGDFNIYAGIFNSQVHIGGIKYNLSEIPPGSRILHADLTMMGLSDEYKAQSGTWSVQMLQPWIADDWSNVDYHWMTRPDSIAAQLLPEVSSPDLVSKQPNTFFHSPEALSRLEARLYNGVVTYRVAGPSDGENNLFSWDSGFGAGSLGRAPVLRIITGPYPDTPPPSPTPELVIITPQSEESILGIAAERMTATAQATASSSDGIPTPTPTQTELPPNWVTPVIIVNTPEPKNAETAVWQSQIATAEALVNGTSTPWPVNAWTATPTLGPTPTRELIPVNDLTATPTPSSTPTSIPQLLKGKIMFRSDRYGNEEGALMVMDPDGGNEALWAASEDTWLEDQLRMSADLSPDGQYRVVVSDYRLESFPDHKLDNFELFIVPTDPDQPTRRLTGLTELGGMSYDAVWSPEGDRIAFVSNSSGGDEIYTIHPDGTDLQRLTFNDWEWDKQPTWSPDGKQIAFWSNRGTARKQIWVMNADGSDQRNISNNEYNDWDPVWVK